MVNKFSIDFYAQSSNGDIHIFLILAFYLHSPNQTKPNQKKNIS